MNSLNSILYIYNIILFYMIGKNEAGHGVHME